MSPNFLPNCFVLCLSHHWQSLTVGDVILVNHVHYGKMIKRISTITLNDSPNVKKLNTHHIKHIKSIQLIGDNSQSVTTTQMGTIATSDIIGKVIYQVKPT